MNCRPSWSSSLLLAVAFGAALIIGGCGDPSTGPNVGDSVVVPGSIHLIWKTAGGGQIQPPTGAPCHFEGSYDLDLQAGTLAWNYCRLNGTDLSDPGAYVLMIGSRALSGDEQARALAAARAVKVSGATSCGADRDARTLEVDGTSRSITYGDDFYACLRQYQHYVETTPLNDLGDALNSIASSR